MKTVRQVSPTRLQKLFLTGQALSPDSALYNMAFRFDIYGELDCDKFIAAFDLVIQNNDCLRMQVSADGQLKITDRAELHMPLLDGDPGDELRTLACRALDLSKSCFDTRLHRINARHHVWYINQHHIITDGAAFVELFRQIESAYLGHEITTPHTFDDIRKLENKSTQSPKFLTASDFWHSRCESRDEDAMPFETSTVRETIELSDDTTMLLKQALNQPGIRSISRDLSIFSVLAATLLVLRYRLFSNTDSTLGAPFHNRRNTTFLGPEFEVGFIKIDVAQHASYSELVRAVQSDVLASMKHSCAGITSAAINNSFSWLLNYLPTGIGDFAGLQCQTQWLHGNAGDAGHALRVQAHDFNQSGKLTLHFDLATKRFSEAQRNRIPRIFVRLLAQCLTDIQAPFAEHTLLNATESRLLHSFNNTSTNTPQHTTLELFYQQLEQNPDAIAIMEANQSLSYQELETQANLVAMRLPQLSVVPLLIARSSDVIIAIVAAMKCGYPFVPLDIQHPDERISSILDELGNPPILCGAGQATRQIRCKEHLIIDDLKLGNPIHQRQAGQLKDVAYIIFTSGTTGVPKGVEIEHQSFANYLTWAAKTYTDNRAIDMPLYSSVAFDLTLTSLFLPLITGGRVIVYTQNMQAGHLDILDVFRDDQVDIVKLTPSHLRVALRALSTQPRSIAKKRRLKSLILGGEDLPRQLAIEALEHLSPELKIYNEYGPTEATIGCMIHQFNPATDTSPSVPIGKPINNSLVYVLDHCAQATPSEFAGSLHLSGGTLARSYYNGSKIAGRPYVTGDKAMRLGNNTLVYLGRQDAQIKFRGARVELEEIRQSALACNLVDDAYVQLVQQQRKTLNAHCSRCGIANNVPRIELDSNSLCNVCQDFESKRPLFDSYFKNLAQLQSELSPRTGTSKNSDCLVLASGGKDSSYMLCKIVEMGFRPIVFTLDNGFLSEHALKNIESMTQRFGLTWVRECPSAMKTIFADSLKRHSNVCDGCFKTIYTLAINYAVAHGIPSIVTGLSRGQLFETRLLDMVETDIFDADEIDRRVSLARKTYHQIEDAVTENLDVSATQDPETFSKIKFFDFYRYCDVSLAEMLEFLDVFAGWIRPPDTGRSSNCLINDVGIYVHKRERQFHNYAIPYAWDVRLNHKTRLQAIDELNDDIDSARVNEILADINYTAIEPPEQNDQQLVVYYTSKHPDTDSAVALREHLSTHLPDYAMPTAFVELDAMPLNTSGKINSKALPKPTRRSGEFQPPRNQTEQILVELWAKTFAMQKISISDNFFDLGGDSITAVQLNMISKAKGILFNPADVFNYPTIAELSEKTKTATGSEPVGSYKPDSGLATDELSELMARVSAGKKTRDQHD